MGIQALGAWNKVGSLNHATARVEAGGAAITMQGSGSIGDDLFRAHIEYSGRKPDVSLDTSTGEVQISQSNTSGFFLQSRRFVLTLQLNSSVAWKIAVDSGSASDVLMLSTVHLESIDVNTGASKENITLGAPSGTVPITINGGALTVNVHRPPGAAASVSVSGGAASLSFDGRQSKAGGTLTAQTSDFDQASDRDQIQVASGAWTRTADARAVGA